MERHPDYQHHHQLVTEELRLIRQVDYERVLLFGAGADPLAAVLYARLTGKPVVCYEPDAETAARAAEAAASYRPLVEVVTGNVSGAAYGEFDLIVIHDGVREKRAALRRIRKRCRDSSALLCRVSEASEPLLWKALTHKSLAGFYPVGRLDLTDSQGFGIFLLASRKHLAESLHYRWPSHLSQAEAADLLAAFNAVCRKDPGIGYPHPLSEQEGREFIAALRENIGSGKKHLLMVEYEGVLAAQAILTPNASRNNRHLAEISRTFVMEPFRGIGLELLALKRIVKRAKDLGVTTLVLDARGGTSAPKRWASIGFKVFGVLPDYSYVRGRYFDGIYMYQTVADFENQFGPCD